MQLIDMGDNRGWKYEKDKPFRSTMWRKGKHRKRTYSGIFVAERAAQDGDQWTDDGYHETLQSVEEDINKVDARLRCDEVSDEGTTVRSPCSSEWDFGGPDVNLSGTETL